MIVRETVRERFTQLVGKLALEQNLLENLKAGLHEPTVWSQLSLWHFVSFQRINPKQAGLFGEWYGRGRADSAPSVISVWMVQLI